MAEIDLNILSQFNQLQNSGVLESLEFYKEENKELKRCLEDTTQLISYTTVDSMLGFLIGKILDYFIPQDLVFIIHPPRSNELRQYFYRGLNKTDETIAPSTFHFFKEFFDNQLTQGLNCENCYFDELKQIYPQQLFAEDFLALKPSLILPLTGIGGTYGIVILGEKIVGGYYTEHDSFYLNHMFTTFSVTMQNGLHYETSITDTKTGLYTYDYFVTRVNDAIADAKRYKRFAGMLILDIDFFKKFNDTYGHLVGDKVLVALAKTLTEELREDDCVARFGGEEFSVLLKECSEDTLFVVAERIRKAINRIELYENGETLSITVSIGCFLITDMDRLTPTIIFEKADKALYYSKGHGRNQTTIHKMGLLEKALLYAE